MTRPLDVLLGAPEVELHEIPSQFGGGPPRMAVTMRCEPDEENPVSMAEWLNEVRDAVLELMTVAYPDVNEESEPKSVAQDVEGVRDIAMMMSRHDRQQFAEARRALVAAAKTGNDRNVILALVAFATSVLDVVDVKGR